MSELNQIKTVGLQVVQEDFATIQEMLDETSESLQNRIGDFDELSLGCKAIHDTDNGHPVYQITANLVKGTPIAHARAEDRKALIAIDSVLRTIKETALHK